jgi:hypothetical protein
MSGQRRNKMVTLTKKNGTTEEKTGSGLDST